MGTDVLYDDGLVVLDVGGFVKPAFSPDDPDEVLRILAQHVPS